MTNVPLPSYPFISKHDEEHKAACEERSRGLEIRLESKLQEMRAAEVTQRAHERSTEMLDRAARAKNAASKVEWLMKAIDIAVAPSKGVKRHQELPPWRHEELTPGLLINLS